MEIITGPVKECRQGMQVVSRPSNQEHAIGKTALSGVLVLVKRSQNNEHIHLSLRNIYDDLGASPADCIPDTTL